MFMINQETIVVFLLLHPTLAGLPHVSEQIGAIISDIFCRRFLLTMYMFTSLQS